MLQQSQYALQQVQQELQHATAKSGDVEERLCVALARADSLVLEIVEVHSVCVCVCVCMRVSKCVCARECVRVREKEGVCVWRRATLCGASMCGFADA